LVANQPRLMRESLTYTIADQNDVEIVGQAEDVAEIPDLVEETGPDCVIISPEKPGSDPKFATHFWDDPSQDHVTLSL
jgi:DNA-binding NarL/FixJ family response regulator